MTTYFEAPDGHGERCIWARGERPEFDATIIRERSVTAGAWPDVVGHMTGTTITTDDKTGAGFDRLVDAVYATDDRMTPTMASRAVTAVLAALTGVPHD